MSTWFFPLGFTGKQHPPQNNKCTCSSPPTRDKFSRLTTRTTIFQVSNYSRSTSMERFQLSARFHQPVVDSSTNYLTRWFYNANLKRRRIECFLTSDPINTGWLKPRRWDNFTSLDTACVQPDYKIPVRTRADCKAEQYEITGSPLSPSDVPAEAVLIGDTNEISPWWQQFPKRWTVVLLCFFSFLLCNMDRVSCPFLSPNIPHNNSWITAFFFSFLFM